MGSTQPRGELPTHAREELRALVSALRTRLEVEARRGPSGAPARPTQRKVVAAAPTPLAEAEAAVAEAPSWAGRKGTPEGLRVVREDLGECTRCKLCTGRKNIVFGVGAPDAEIMFIGEAPGRDEDEQGEPFVGRAGQLLTKMIEAMGLSREQVYIANIIKCRPPENRAPEPDEVAACEPFLRRQIDAISPRLIIGLGGVAVQTLLRTRTGITALRGRFHVYQGVKLMPTFHPAFLLRSPNMKKPAWEDLKQVMAEMDRLGLARDRSKR